MVTRGKRVSKLAEMPLDASLTDIAAEGKEAEVAAGIKHLLKENKIHAKKTVIGLSGLHCLTRPLNLPELPRAMLAEAIMREAKRVLPVPVEQMYISWQIIAVSDGKIQAFMVAIPKQIADTLFNILNQAGFKPYLMDIKPLALARLVKETSAIIVDVQSSEFDIINLVDGVPQPVRTVSFPEESQSLADKMLVVKDELNRTVQFYNSNNPDRPVSTGATLIVSGGLADEPELYQSLAEELGFKVSVLSSPLKCLKQLDPSRYLVNIGLALKELTGEAGPLIANINTLPIPYKPRQVSLGRLMSIPATAAAIGLILLLVMTVQDTAASINSVQNQLDFTNLLLGKKQAQKRELTESLAVMEQKVSDIETDCSKFTTALNGLDKKGDLINGDLEATVDNVVDGLVLGGIGHSGGQLNITGRVESEQEVLEYVRKLDTTGRFTEITIDRLTLVKASDNESESIDFSLILRLEE
jgi:type IV pilus assembly protein PilM